MYRDCTCVGATYILLLKPWVGHQWLCRVIDLECQANLEEPLVFIHKLRDVDQIGFVVLEDDHIQDAQPVRLFCF